VVLEAQTSGSKIILPTSVASAGGDRSDGSVIDDGIELLTHWAEKEFGQDELIAARDEFFSTFGKVFHDDPFFGARMSYFHNYFLFDRPLRRQDARVVTPTRFYLDTNPERRDATAIQAVHELSLCVHSIFQVRKIKGDTAEFTNMLNSEAVPVRLPRSYRLFGLGKNQMIQGFVFRASGGYHPAAGLIFHPDPAQKVIRKYLKNAAKDEGCDHLALLAKLASTQLKAVRMKHVDTSTIYKMELL
jgi:hypothetical protein